MKKRHCFRAYGVVAALGLIPIAGHGAVQFIGLGDLPGGQFNSAALAISADGSTVVGISESALSAPTGFEAFRWTAATGMVGLGDLAGGAFDSEARGVSADGQVVTGVSTTAALQKGFRWTEASGMVALPNTPGAPNGSTAGQAVSADGKQVIGYNSTVTGGYFEAAIWTGTSGSVLLGDLPGGVDYSVGYAATPDAGLVVGLSYEGASPQAMFWSQSTGMVGIGYLEPAGTESSALAVSADGSVIIGDSKSGIGKTKAFRWTLGTGMTGFGQLPGSDGESHASAISADGSIILGNGTSSNGSEGFIWDARDGIRGLKAYLLAQGAPIADWRITGTAISADGRRIAGRGRNAAGDPEAWLAIILPDPPTIALAGKTVIRAKSSGKYLLRGTASDDAAVTRVEYRVANKGPWKVAQGQTAWRIRGKLTDARRTRLAVRAVDADNQKSPIVLATILP